LRKSPSSRDSLARMAIYSELIFRPVRKNCCFGRLDLPRLVMTVLIISVERPSVVTAI
jgi:hypothetical protein